MPVNQLFAKLDELMGKVEGQHTELVTLSKLNQEYLERKLEIGFESVKHAFENVGDRIALSFERTGKDIVAEHKSLRDTLVPAATGQKKIDIEVVMAIVKALSIVMIVLVVWLTGIKPSLPVLLEYITGHTSTSTTVVQTP